MIETQYITVGELNFTVDVAGEPSSPAVIMLHGFPQSRHSWSPMAGMLASHGFRAIAPDQRGYSPGARPTDVSDYHTDHLIRDVVALADAFDIDRFHLVGHDWGGQIAWLTATQHSERLLSLTVLSRPHPAAFAQAMERDAAQANRSRHHKAFQDQDMASKLLAEGAKAVRNTLCFENAQGLFGKEATQGPLKRRMSDAMADQHLSVLGTEQAMNAALNWYRSAFAGGSTLAIADVPPVTVPTLYLWGNEDMSVGKIAATLTADQVHALYTFETIDGA
ncbi:MAG: alpha/beta hydrolase, partial [Chromatiales bacterium]|nr:alpha/beta hydrolase [Chromatiales bacterium]